MHNKISIGKEEQKKIQLQILSAINEFCEKNTIKYSLAYGTLLGCIRHKGYIPWDDDIDIMMLREDYDKFLKTFSHKYYKVVDKEQKSGYWHPYGKVYDNRTIIEEFSNMPLQIGINVDIFPVDNLPDKLSDCKKLYRKKSIFNILHILKIVKPNRERHNIKNMILKIAQISLKYIPMTFIVDRMVRLSKSYNDTDTQWKGIIVASDDTLRERLPASVFFNYTNAKFEGLEFKIITEYDKYLTAVYGDYMKLPPLEKRVTHHNFKAFRKQ